MKNLILLLVVSLASTGAFAQHSVSGRVTDEANEPLIGVNISEQGTFYGTTTNVYGEYELTVTFKWHFFFFKHFCAACKGNKYQT